MTNKFYRVNAENYNNTIEALRREGFRFPNNLNPTYTEAKKWYHGNSKLLIHTFYNSITRKNEMQITTLSVIKTYPQYKHIRINIEEATI